TITAPNAATKVTKTRKHETRKTSKVGRQMLRIPSPLPEDVEQLMHDTIGCCIAVHRELGPGLLETIYSRALCLELAAAGISFEREKRYPALLFWPKA